MTLDGGYFDGLYSADDDPWALASRWYEQRKYATTLAALPRQRYRSGFEPGCSVGALTVLLADRCDELLAVDVAAAPVQTTRRRVGRRPGVVVEQRTLPDDWPAGRFDLIVLSELGYYFDPPDLRRLLDAAAGSLEPGGDLVVAHWRHPVADYPQRGDAVHRALADTAGLARTVRHEEADFLLEVYARTPPEPRSVAAREGLC